MKFKRIIYKMNSHPGIQAVKRVEVIVAIDKWVNAPF